MADTKISAMTAAVEPLSGSEIVPALQSAANVRTTVGAIVALAIGVTGPPGQSYGSAILSGCNLIWTSLLNVTVTGGLAAINGTIYPIVQTDLTHSAADPTNPRFDVIVVNTSGVAAIVEGIPAANPAEPAIDPSTQVPRALVYIPALATSLTIDVTNVYLEDTEWTTSVFDASIVANSTNNPFAGTVDVEATSAANGDWIEFDKGSTFDSTGMNFLTFRLRSKAPWPSQKNLSFQFRDAAGIPQGTAVNIRTGAYGYNSSTLSYLAVAIPKESFSIVGLTVQKLRVTVTGGGANIGWYLDNVIIQGGLSTIQNAYLRYKGNYSPTFQYVTNDIVTHNGLLHYAPRTILGETPGISGWVQMISNFFVNPMSTGGDIIYGGASGVATRLANGAAGQVLVSSGGTAAPTWKQFPQTTLTLTDAATVAWDGALGAVAKVTLGGNRTLGAPTNLIDGGTYVLRVIQDGTGTRTLAYNAVFKWPGGTDPVLSTAIDAIDILTFVSDGTNMYGVSQLAFAT